MAAMTHTSPFRRFRRLAAFLAVAVAGMFAVVIPLWAQTTGQGDGVPTGGAERYDICMKMAFGTPELALNEANAWGKEGGGLPAEHCASVALLNMGRLEEGASRLTAMADAMTGMRPELRIGAYGQAGQAWTMAGDSKAALAVQSKGLTLDPDNVELLIDRSFSHALTKDFWAALDDLNKASDLAPNRPDILVYRATTYRFLETPELALDDANRALVLAPDLPEGLLERGILRRLTGDEAGAKADWERLIQVAPQSAAAQSARQNLERITKP